VFFEYFSNFCEKYINKHGEYDFYFKEKIFFKTSKAVKQREKKGLIFL